MHIKYHQISDLPRLAWLADADKVKKEVHVYHGPRVEARDLFFIEGTWNGPFEEGNFATTDCIFGTGCISQDNKIVFVSSASTTDYLYYKDTGTHVLVSNSLPFLLARLDDLLDPEFSGYDRINYSIINGINEYIKEIPTVHGAVSRLMYKNLIVSEEGAVETEKDMTPQFKKYHDYYYYIVRNYELITRNIRDSSRTYKMEIFSTQSKGYDTTAVNAIAAKFGIDKVFTVSKGKGVGYFVGRDKHAQVDDDGTEICKTLGLKCIQIDRRAFEKEFEQEYLYYTALDSNQDVNLMDINKYVSNVSILLTGCLGEIWYPSQSCIGRPSYINSELKRWDLGNHGLSEVRLVAGFIQLPLPYIGARRREDILRITEASEMNQWRLGTLYDRPIPRRIAEEAGMPRELFGQKKMAAVVEFPLPSIPYGQQLRQDYFKFHEDNHLLPRWKLQLYPIVHYVNSMLVFKHQRRYRWIYYLERIISKIIGRDYAFPLLWNRFKGSVFCFCVNKRIKDYERILRGGTCKSFDYQHSAKPTTTDVSLIISERLS